MVEQIVDFILGFVICGLIGLAFLPLVSRRARRLTLARIEARLPMTFDEIEAERDLLRARFAVDLRALEIKAAQERLVHANDEAELGRRALAIRQANEQWAQTDALLNDTQAKLAQALDFGEKTLAELTNTREALAARTQELEQKNRDYADLGEAHRELETCVASLGVALDKAESRLAEFDARRKRLLAKFVAERQRGDDFEKIKSRFAPRPCGRRRRRKHARSGDRFGRRGLFHHAGTRNAGSARSHRQDRPAGGAIRRSAGLTAPNLISIDARLDLAPRN